MHIRTKDGFRAISFKHIGVLDSYFIDIIIDNNNNHNIQAKFDFG